MKRLIWIPVLAGSIYAAVQFWPTPPLTIALHSVTKGNVEQIAANSRAGTIKACRSANLSLNLGGRVGELLVDEGDSVTQGQLLIALDNELDEARVELAEKEQRAAQIETERACELSALAKREFERSKSLLDQKLISNERVDQLESEAASQNFLCKQRKALTDAAIAKTKFAQIQLKQTQLSAPFNGVISKVNGEVGEYLTPSPSGVATPAAIQIIDDSCLYVSAPIDEVEASRVQIGQNARLTLDAFRGTTFHGVISKKAVTVTDNEKQARTLEIEAQFVNPPAELMLLVGYSADAEIITKTAENVLRIPSEALIAGQKVLAYNPTTQTIEYRAVTSGESNWNWTEIKTGLSVGDQILLDTAHANNLVGKQVLVRHD
jgi:HlyD family secretion protein